MTKPTFFQTGPDKVAPVKKLLEGEIPDYPSGDEGFQNKKKKEPYQAGNRGNVADLLKSVSVGRGGELEIDDKKAIRELNKISDDVSEFFTKGTDVQNRKVLDDVSDVVDTPGAGIVAAVAKQSKRVDGILNKVKGTVNIKGLKTLIEGGDIESAHGIANIINSLADGSAIKVESFTTKMKVINSLIEDLEKYGVLSAIDYVLDTMQDIESKKRLLAKMVPSFFHASDVDNLNLACDVLGTGRVMAIYPKGIQAFIAGFRIPVRTPPSKYSKHWNRVIKLFNRLDSKWNVTVRNGVEINDLRAMIKMNKQFYDVFKYIDYTKLNFDPFVGSGDTREDQVKRFTAMVMIARSYRVGDKERLLQREYPESNFTWKRR